MAIPCHEDPERASLFLRDGCSILDASIRATCIDEDQALGMIDGTLTSDERANIERHIDTCSACRELLSGLAQQSAFSGKPSPSSFPASAAFAQTQRALPETRNVALSVSMPRTHAPVRTPISAPPPTAPAQRTPASSVVPEKVASNAPILIALGVGLGLFALALVAIVLGAAGLFYAGGRLVESEPEVAPLPPLASTEPPPSEPLEPSPSEPTPTYELPSIPGVTASLEHEHLMCTTDLGVLAHHTYVSEGLFVAAQASAGCQVVLDDATLRGAGMFGSHDVLRITGDDTLSITIRNSRIEGDVLVVGSPHVRFEDCDIHGTLTGPMEVIRSRHAGTRGRNVRFIP